MKYQIAGIDYFIIYDHPSDFPDHTVSRWHFQPLNCSTIYPHKWAIYWDNIKQASIWAQSSGMDRMDERYIGDPAIAEIWTDLREGTH